MPSGKFERKELCTQEVAEVIVPLSSSKIHGSRYKEGAPSRDYVRFTVYEEYKPRDKRTDDDRKLFINDHREETLRAARLSQDSSAGKRLLPKWNRAGSKTMSFSEAVRLPARVVVVEIASEISTITYVNLYRSEGKKASGLFVVLSELLIKEKLFLDKIVKHEPRWWWGGRKNTSFGPSGDTLPVVALTDGNRKIIFHCRKSCDIVTLGSEFKADSPLLM
ncbi:MAG: hypothetical protein A2V96_00680 [Candidatus Yonathbacteria bacterium RBG_16_43_6]|uniref:Uncharacterized protein n=2 Tax=Parcubacteria group TaxID=1794811 RepID=A0A1G2SCT1_9BACT|nr:MAG: hypothetical protein UW78_C0008G0003 [Candidatus Azambacteria bacterium GW2011_GWA1_44_9]OHA79586.1 MAG: hypothetical protein A2V96_00680 [Candidatus Yonathbacteria bacterium RBG_16_43_6]OHA82532.1 MAG: hypothetical protein A3B07_02845 [Candidatus Yonathbacteria bacterium RIFCSPLOWO2_01_FULL_43_27]